MAVRMSSRTLPDTYFDLVRQFPLMRIKDGEHLAEAHAMLDSVLQMELDEGGEEYLNALADHIEIYENEHEQLPDAPACDVLEYLMTSHGLTQMRLSEETGIAQSTISAVLNGSRNLTVEHIARLAAYFHVPSSVFLPN